MLFSFFSLYFYSPVCEIYTVNCSRYTSRCMLWERERVSILFERRTLGYIQLYADSVSCFHSVCALYTLTRISFFLSHNIDILRLFFFFEKFATQKNVNHIFAISIATHFQALNPLATAKKRATSKESDPNTHDSNDDSLQRDLRHLILSLIAINFSSHVCTILDGHSK